MGWQHVELATLGRGCSAAKANYDKQVSDGGPFRPEWAAAPVLGDNGRLFA